MAAQIHGAIVRGKQQGGFALIALILMIVMIGAYAVVHALNRSSGELSNAREQRSMDALRQAKAALLAYAASEQWQLYKTPGTYFQPGALPCPDKNDNGASDCTGSTTSSMLGRLPWTTLGIDDLRDASGERLWYALSWNFRKLQGGTPPTLINSDTPGQLTATGTAAASQIVAVVFAPGAAIQNQSRPASTTDPLHNNPANYLEGFNLTDPVYYTFTSNALPSDTFNDRLIVITQADLMAAVEPVVSARIQRDIKPYLDTYRNTWGRYPFPAPFSNPGTASSYKNVAAMQTGLPGLLPITADPTFVAWQNPLSTVISEPPPGGLITSQDCTASSAALIDCTVTYGGTPTLSFSLTALNAGKAIVRQHVMTDLTVTTSGLPPAAFASVNSLQPDGSGTITLSLAMSATAAPVRIQIPPPPYDAPTLALTDPASNAYWFIANQWYQNILYAVAPDFLPGGGGSCGGTAPCLTVMNVASSNNKAVMILAGRSLTSNPRPSNVPGDYLEGANLASFTTPAYAYENHIGNAGMSASAPSVFINDRVVAFP